MSSFLELCRRRGFKATPQRLEIFRQVARTEEHPEAEAIHVRVREMMPTVSPDTVYRTLAFLEDNGLIRKLSLLHGSARFDANLERHHHFICTECGGAWDFHNEALDDFSSPPEVSALGSVISVHAELHGVCKVCESARPRSRVSSQQKEHTT
jgi:Fur family peroxide stress response transcriptional regulator